MCTARHDELAKGFNYNVLCYNILCWQNVLVNPILHLNVFIIEISGQILIASCYKIVREFVCLLNMHASTTQPTVVKLSKPRRLYFLFRKYAISITSKNRLLINQILQYTVIY